MDLKSLVTANANERWLILANFLRQVGMQGAYFLGILGYAAYGFGGIATIVMTIMLIVNIANMVGSIIGGAIVDRIGPRKTILYSSIAVVLISLSALLTQGNVTAFAVFVAFFGLSTTILNTAFSSFAPYLEKGKVGLRRVNSFLTIGAFIATVIGPAIGAIATGIFPVYSVFIILAVVTAAAALITIKVHEVYAPHLESEDDDDVQHETEKPNAEQDVVAASEALAQAHGIQLTDPVRVTETSITPGTALAGRDLTKRQVKEKANPFKEAMEGWHIIRQSRSLRYYLMVAVAMIFGFGAFDALEPIFFQQVLAVDISVLGWIYALAGVGLIIGVVALALFPIKWVNSRLLIWVLIICGFGAVAYVATTNLWIVAVGQLITGVAFGIFDPLMRTMVQADSPLKAVGRVLGTINMISLGLLLIPLVIAPWLSNLWGVQPVLILAGATPIIFGLLLFPEGRRIDKATASSRNIESLDVLE